MQLEVKGRHVEVNDSIRDYAERKLAKLDKQLHADVLVEVHLSTEHNPSIAASQVADATVVLKGGHVLHARAAAPDMKAAIDELAEKLLRQLRETREKRSSIWKRKSRKPAE
jgi:putative sigma-54 modulation protein